MTYEKRASFARIRVDNNVVTMAWTRERLKGEGQDYEVSCTVEVVRSD